MAFTVAVTSMPLPVVLVAEFKMALTAFWTVSSAAEVEEMLLVLLVLLVRLDS
jgi:hypothetical protein